MATIEVQPPYPAFAGADGQPLENGYIWIGAVNLNPQVNPITAYWDDASMDTQVIKVHHLVFM